MPSRLPWISRETSHTLKRFKTRRKRYHETHPSVQELLLKSNAMAQDKTRYESQLAATRSSAHLLPTSSLQRIKHPQSSKNQFLKICFIPSLKTSESRGRRYQTIVANYL